MVTIVHHFNICLLEIQQNAPEGQFQNKYGYEYYSDYKAGVHSF